MGLGWFKMHTEARNDAKLRTLTDAEFRVWFNLLCMASEERHDKSRDVTPCHTRGSVTGVTGVTDEILALEVAHGDVELLSTTIQKLVKLRILEVEDDDCLTFCNFRKRQYDKPSDVPEATRERKAKSRAVSRAVTPLSRAVTHGHALEENRI